MKNFYLFLTTLVLGMAVFATNAQETPNAASKTIDIITTPPAGTVKYYHRTGNSLIIKALRVMDVAQQGDIEVIEGEDGYVYLKDIVCFYEAGSYVRGTMEGNTITVPLGQQLHKYDLLEPLITYCSELWFGDVYRTYANSVLTSGSVARNTDITEAVFLIDGDNIMLQDSNPNHVLGVFYDDTYRWAGYADYLEDSSPEYVPAKPATPEILSIEIDPDTWTAYMTCNVPLEDINGHPLASQKLYYRIFTDVQHSIDQFYASADNYTDVDDEGMYDIPYTFDNGTQITTGAATFNLITPLAESLNRVGIQSVYIDEELPHLAPAVNFESEITLPNESDIFWYTIKEFEETGIDDVMTEKTAVGTRYYNPAGIASETPHGGMNIKVTTYSEGSKKAIKIIR
ncbi:MAG: hypothetical protein J5565_04300 [Muribaculaceae bacterium]|nr:hypothetical protein [Muribaculaceae bacterium]